MADTLISSVWLDKPKYEEIEAKSEEKLAEDHSGLKIEVGTLF